MADDPLGSLFGAPHDPLHDLFGAAPNEDWSTNPLKRRDTPILDSVFGQEAKPTSVAEDLKAAPPQTARSLKKQQEVDDNQSVPGYLAHGLESGVYAAAGMAGDVAESFNPVSGARNLWLRNKDLAHQVMTLAHGVETGNTHEILVGDNKSFLRTQAEMDASTPFTRFAERMQRDSQELSQTPDGQKYNDLVYATTDPDKSALLSPVKLVHDALQSLPSTAAMATTVFLTRGAAVKGYAEAIAAGFSREEANAIAVRAAGKVASLAGAGGEGLVGGLQQGEQTRVQVLDGKEPTSPIYKAMIEAGVSPKDARQYVATEAGGEAGLAAGVVDAATNVAEGPILGKIIGEGGPLVKRVAKGFAAEGVQEGVQGAGEQVGQNYAVQQYVDPKQKLGDQVAENVIASFAVGGLTGGVFAAAGSHNIHEEQQAAASARGAPLVTPEDHASPLPTDLIQQGKGQAEIDLDKQTLDLVDKYLPGATNEAGGISQNIGEESQISARTKPGKARLPSDVVDGLIKLGIPEHAARAAAAGTVAEAGGDDAAVNPTSGAIGLGQWLGARKDELERRYGPNPTRQQQIEFLAYELKGGDSGGKAVLEAKDENSALDAYVRKFMRPALGRDTDADLKRGLAALGGGEVDTSGIAAAPAAQADEATAATDQIPMPDVGEQPPPTKDQSEGAGLTDLSAVEQAQLKDHIEEQAGQVAEPTEAQKEAGNYKKGHINLHGLDITIETPKGAERSGVAPDGTQWSVKMPDHYGYVKRTLGADEEQVDVYVGPKPESQRVFVIDQNHADTGKFDEHKAMLGYSSPEEATAAYHSAFDDGRGPERLGNVTEMSVPTFKDWLSEEQTKPVAPELSKQDQLKANLAASREAPAFDREFAKSDGLSVVDANMQMRKYTRDEQQAFRTGAWDVAGRPSGWKNLVADPERAQAITEDERLAKIYTEGRKAMSNELLKREKAHVAQQSASGIPAAPAEKPAKFEPLDHVPRLKEIVAKRNVSLADNKAVAKALGLKPLEAHRVMGVLAGQQNSGVYISKKGILRRVAKRQTPLHLMEFVRSIGGVRSDGHDLRNVGALARYPGVINNKSGKSVDEIGESLHEAGYVHTGGRPTESETLDLLDRGSHERIYAREDINAAAELQQKKQSSDEEEHHLDELRGIAEEHDLSLTEEDLRTALGFVADGETHEYAVGAAIREAAARTLELGTEQTGNDFYAEIANELYRGEHAEVRDYGPLEARDGQGRVAEGESRREAPRGQSQEAGVAPERTQHPEQAQPPKQAVSTAPEHATVGVDDRELSEIVQDFDSVRASQGEGEDQVTHIFDPPAKGEIVRLNERSRVYHKEHGWMTPAQARAKIREWEQHAVDQGKDPKTRSANGDKIVLSFFDLSGEWSLPWDQAGYQVWRFDIQNDPADAPAEEKMGDVNNFSSEFFSDWFGDFEGKDIHAILAACPCTDFAVSGARHFAAKDADGRTVASVKLVQQTLAAIEYLKPAVWAIENPVGRIEKLGGLPPWRLSFDPNDVGETYTKKTLLWGRFNADMPIAPVEPVEGSKMHKQYGGKSLATKNARSVTPEGFSYSFFMANNAIDHPAMTIANKYDRLDRALIEKAVKAGVTEEQIDEAVQDHYYQDLDDEAANEAIRDLIADETGSRAFNQTKVPQPPAGETLDEQIERANGTAAQQTVGKPSIGPGYSWQERSNLGNTVPNGGMVLDLATAEGGREFIFDKKGKFVAGPLGVDGEVLAPGKGALAPRPTDTRDMLQRKANERLKPAKEQKPVGSDGGLFDTQDTTGDLFQQPKPSKEAAPRNPYPAQTDTHGQYEQGYKDRIEGRPAVYPGSLPGNERKVRRGFEAEARAYDEGYAAAPAHNQPLAAPGLTSFRYKGRYGPVMIGAKDASDALTQAARSIDGDAYVSKLERWDGSKYVPVKEIPGAPEPSTYGARNKLVTKDRADELRAKIRDKLKTQLNSGIDPEMLAMGAELAAFHIEAGARKFGDFAQAIASDLGVKIADIRQYLRAWYNGARDLMEDMGAPVADMDGPEEVRASLKALEEGNVPSADRGLERDRPGAEARDTGGEAAVPAEGRAAGQGTRGAVGEAGGRGGQQPEREGGLFPAVAAPVGEAGNLGLFDRPSEPEGGAADVRGRGGSLDRSEQRLDAERTPAAAVEASAGAGASLEAKRTAQAAANKVAVQPRNRANVDATLPFLKPEQRDDVFKAEESFAKREGFMLTNGTGTGKTFSGGGVVARYVRQGKSDILIVAPSQDILKDWKLALAELGVEANILESASESGKGVTLTTYANLGSNKSLSDRKWHLAVADESHKLMSSKDATVTANVTAFRALTNHPLGRFERAQNQLRKEWGPLLARRASAKPNTNAAVEAQIDALYTKTRDLSDTFASQPRSKALFLSATPFAYVEAVDYANGYLFDYSLSEAGQRRQGGYNQPDARGEFFITNFGYRMRTGKLTKPDAGVNTEVMEREFHERLKREGALSGRALDVDKDYDRKFVLVADGVGAQIDQALDFLTSAEGGRFHPLYDLIRRNFDYLKRMRLLEAINAHHVIPIIREHHKLGRKVVVFHQYNEGGGFNPFLMSIPEGAKVIGYKDGQPTEEELQPLYDEFLRKNPYVEKMDFSRMAAPIVTLGNAFPDAMFYNGRVSGAKRRENKRLFNEDGNDKNLIVVQADAGEAGISLHDTTGKHQRATINLGMPVRPMTAIQQEGRTYRVGQASDAIFRYLTTGTGWERSTFAHKVAERASTAENLGMGDLARALRQSFIDAYTEADENPPTENEGTGGKEKDRSAFKLTPYERAKAYYYGQQKNTKSRNYREGVDYYATPEPVGFKMAEWAGLKTGDKALEPSAGHGSIARFLREDTDRTVIEPSAELASKAALSSPGARMLVERFEDLHAVNKYDGIVMNPPFGVGGKTAMDHVAKAATHLRNGGRIVALIPEGGQMDSRFDKWMESDAAKGIYQVGEVLLPDVTFERAGTKIRSRIVILEKQTDAESVKQLPQAKRVDLTGIGSTKELFDRLENTSFPDRVEPQTKEKTIEAGADGNVTVGGHRFKLNTGSDTQAWVAKPGFIGRQEFARIARAAEGAGGDYRSGTGFAFKDEDARKAFLEAVERGDDNKPQIVENGVTKPVGTRLELAETTHAKKGIPLYVAQLGDRVESDEFARLREIAKENGGYWSSYRGAGAIPGFQFESEADRQKFVDKVQVGEAPMFQQREAGEQPVTDGEQLRIAHEASRLIKQLIPDDKVALKFAFSLSDAMDNRFNGEYFMRVITLALDSQHPTWTLGHEALHAMKAMGLFTPTEWNLLVKAAWTNDPKMQAYVRRGWAKQNLTEEQLQEEAVAEYFGEQVHLMQSGEVKSLAARILRRIVNVVVAVAKAVHAIRGNTKGLEAISAFRLMEKMRTGKIGARPVGFGEASRDKPMNPTTVTFGKKDGARYQPAPGPLGINDNAEPRLFTPARAIVDAIHSGSSDKIGDAIDRFRYALQDRMLPVLRTQAKVERMLGRKLADEENPYLAEELYHGRTGARLEKLTDKYVEPLFEGMRAAKVTPEELETYLYARHAKERNARIQSINPEFTEGGSGMTDEEATSILEAVDASPKAADVKELAGVVDKMLNFALQTRIESGLLSPEEAAAWKNLYQHYVPLRGRPGDLDSEGQAARISRQSGMSVRGKESRRAFGRKSKAADIIAYSMLQAEEAIVRSEQNEVAKSFLELARAAPDKSFWTINKIKRVPVMLASGQVSYRAESRIAAEDAPYTVSAKVEGQEYRVTMNRDDAAAAKTAAAMRNLDIQQFQFVVKTLGAVNRFLSKINTTYSPEFIISNAFRDLQTAGINLAGEDVKGLESKVLKDYPGALRAALKGAFGKDSGEWGNWYREFKLEGGQTAFNAAPDLKHLRAKVAKSAKLASRSRLGAKQLLVNLVHAIEGVNDGVENALRLSTYKNARELGVSKRQAASLAKNVTVNFNRKGTAGPLINSLYLFFNASMQGNARILVAMKSKKVQRILLGAVVAGFLLQLLNKDWSDKDKDGESFYDKIPEFEKQRNLILMTDGGKYIKIPMPWGYNVFPNFGRMLARLWEGERPMVALGDWGTGVIDAFNPIGGAQSILDVLSPTITDPIVDLEQNRDYAGRPIMPDEKDFGPQPPDSQRYWNSVPAYDKAVTDFLNSATGGDSIRPGAIDMSPETLDFLQQTVFGAAGNFVRNNLALAGKAFSNDPTQEFERNDIPFARKVIGGKPGWYDKAAFYSRLAEVEQDVDYGKKYVKAGDREGLQKLVADEGDVLALEKAAKQARKEMRGERKVERELQTAQARGDVNGDDANRAKAAIQAREKQTIDAFNRLYLATVAKPIHP